MRELVDYAKERPGKLNFASPGQALEMEVFRKLTALEMTHIPYKGAGPAVTAVVAGEAQLMFVTLSSAVAFVKGGRLRALAITTPRRADVLPDVPTMAEAGYPGLIGGSWQGIFVPRGTSSAIVGKLYTATRQVMALDEIKQRLAAGGVQVVTSASSAEFARFVVAQTAQWAKVVREAGITAD